MNKQAFAALCLVLCLLLPATVPALEGPIYQIFPSSFYDSNGDGTGDLAGIESKIPYLKDLSVGGVWLNPIHPSPSYHRYDVIDYRAVDPSLGTMADFERLAQSLRQAGLSLVMDLVVNHTSNAHPWFLSAVSSLSAAPCGQSACSCPRPQSCPTHNPYINYYVFDREGGKPGFHAVPGADGLWYFGAFGPHMPDLNLDDPAVRQEISDIAAFWLGKGVTGFRLDAVIHFYEQNTSKNAEFLRWFVKQVKALRPDAYIVGEAWTDPAAISALYQSGIDSLFDFAGAGTDGHMVKALRGKQGKAYAAGLEKRLGSLPKHAVHAPFLGNHDMGRIAGALRRDDRQLKQAATLLLMQPGVPFLYYGDELGLTGSGRDENKRLPMLWEEAVPDPLPPQDADQAQKQDRGVATQTADPTSLLSYVRTLLALRHALGALRHGAVTALDVGNDAVIAYTLQGDDSVTVLINPAKEAVDTTYVLPRAPRLIETHGAPRNIPIGQPVTLPPMAIILC